MMHFRCGGAKVRFPHNLQGYMANVSFLVEANNLWRVFVKPKTLLFSASKIKNSPLVDAKA